MAKALAFFPWAAIGEPTIVGPVRLLPWEKSRIPNNLPHAKLYDIDAVLGAYANQPSQHIYRATLLEYDQWLTGTDVENWVGDLFRARAIIGFAALACRRLFIQDRNYCNYDTYSLLVQPYKADHGSTFIFTTRRRDGGRELLWRSDNFAFHRPYHVGH